MSTHNTGFYERQKLSFNYHQISYMHIYVTSSSVKFLLQLAAFQEVPLTAKIILTFY